LSAAGRDAAKAEKTIATRSVAELRTIFESLGRNQQHSKNISDALLDVKIFEVAASADRESSWAYHATFTLMALA
jgi:hypothetical protein